MSTAQTSTSTNTSKSSKGKAKGKADNGSALAQNQVDAKRAELVAAGVVTEDELGEFGVVNPDLHYYKMVEEDGSKNALRGIVLERRQRPDHAESGGYYYVVVLTRACALYTGEGEKVDAQPGDYAWVDERWAFRPLAGFLPVKTPDANGVMGMTQVSEVIIMPDKKVQLKGGRSLWKATIQARHIAPEAAGGIKLLAPAGDPIRPDVAKDDEQGEILF